MKLSLQGYSQELPRECLMNWLQCSFLCFFKLSWGGPLNNINSFLTVWVVIASWCCNMPKFLFTDKLLVRKLESIIWNSLPANLLVCPINGGHSVTVWHYLPEVLVSHGPSIGTAWNNLQANVWLPWHLGVRAMASNISYFLLLFGRNSILDFQAQRVSSIQRCLC